MCNFKLKFNLRIFFSLYISFSWSFFIFFEQPNQFQDTVFVKKSKEIFSLKTVIRVNKIYFIFSLKQLFLGIIFEYSVGDRL